MMNSAIDYPDAMDPERVGTYPGLVRAGGGYVWDEVLEYRVWCHRRHGGDIFHAFATHAEAETFARATPGAEAPLALILQEEYIDEPQPGSFVHVKEPRIAEWPVAFLVRPRRTARTIPDFLAAPREIWN